MTVFVILHYNSIEDSITCIESVLRIAEYEKVRIVVVDNNSPNGSGKKLVLKYQDNPYVTIILNDSNYGFSKGNNIGCSFAIKTYKPDFICVFNNDIYIEDPDFIKKININFSKTRFDALGPKVWNTKRKINHNPFNVLSSLSEVNHEVRIAKKGAYLLNCPFPLLYYFYINYMIKQKYPVKQGLHCSAIIFSSNYFAKFPEVFPEFTFLYGEENLLNYRREKYGLNYVFDFDICVFHNHSSSTRSIYKSPVEKWRYQNKYIMESLLKLREIYEKDLTI